MGVVDLGKYGLARRDCPNVIVPTLAISAVNTAGVAWAPSAAMTQITAGLAYEFLLDSMIVNTGIGVSVVTSVTVADFFRHLCHLRVGTGAAVETVVAEAQIAESAFLNISGMTAETITASLIVTTSRDIPLAPVRIPASTRIAYDASIDGSPGYKALRVYLSGYDLSTYDFAKVPGYDSLYHYGIRPVYPDVNPLQSQVVITTGAGNWTLGAWAEVTASLDADYLILGAASVDTEVTAKEAQFDVGLGSETVVVQSRWGMPYNASRHNATHIRWGTPFIAYAGERLAVRGAATTASRVYNVTLYGVRLN